MEIIKYCINLIKYIKKVNRDRFKKYIWFKCKFYAK